MLLLLLCCVLPTAHVSALHQQVNESNLRKLLTSSEWTALFGPSQHPPVFSLVRPRLPPELKLRRRKRRSDAPHDLLLEAGALGRRFQLKLRPSPALLDPHFLLLNRWQNRTETLPEDLVEDCYYQSRGEDRAAVALCGGMRGIIASSSNKYYIIKPLPERFQKSSYDNPHVVVEWQPPDRGTTPHSRGTTQHSSLKSDLQTQNNVDWEDPKSDSPRQTRNKYSSLHHRSKRSVTPFLIEFNPSKSKRKYLHKEYVNRSVPVFDNNKLRDLLNVRASILSTTTYANKSGFPRQESHNVNVPLEGKLASSFQEHNLDTLVKGVNKMGCNKPYVNHKCIESLMEHVKLQQPKKQISKNIRPQRRKRSTLLPGAPVYVETAVFVDRDLYRHMALNFPTDTERELVRVVLAMINAVQLLYHDSSLGRQVNFVLKRLEILHEDPASLNRPHDIDRFLSSFCLWQRGENPTGDSDPQHWDHALILTGLDLYVVSKNGKVSSQVVGLAPVAGMCTATSSCTVNEGRHFESVYVVAHEIGHNLGMRHDGPLAENECDPSSFIMSPTLGSGKITWSSCSRRYLQTFLENTQSQCLLDHSSSAGHLDHSAEGTLPGERFDANHQCMLKYGRGSIHSPQQLVDDVCRDLHCQRDRYTWTSHPALEGTFCGTNKWCRSGRCIARGLSALQAGYSPNQRVNGAWSDWSSFSDCASGCLYSEEGRLHAGSSGIMVSTRRCNNPRPENGGLACGGSDRRFRTCQAEQCGNVQRTTIRDFADQICARARDVDTEILGTGLQRISSDSEEACTVWCYKRNGGSKSRGWTFPDGTTCQSRRSRYGKSMYCISGRCEEFVCDNSDLSAFTNSPDLCSNSVGRIFRRNKGRRREATEIRNVWAPASGCHFNCLAPGSGLRLVVAKDRECQFEEGCATSTSIQLCQPDKLGCGRLKTPFEHATTVCSKYRERVSRLSGLGMQISPAAEDPDRPCRVACQDDSVNHRFYLVNGEDGWFPFGTDCSRGLHDKKAFCVSGKCLEFGPDDTPLHESEYALPLLSRLKRNLSSNLTKMKAVLDETMLKYIILSLNFTGNTSSNGLTSNRQSEISVDFHNPVHTEVRNEVQH